MSARRRVALACAALLAPACAGAPDRFDRAPPRPDLRAECRLDCRVECIVDDAQDRLEVELTASGLDPAKRDLAFELPTWGEWLELDEYYVTRVQGVPPVHHDLVNRMYWRPELPADWDGRLAIHYAVPIVRLESAAHARLGLAPWRTATYVHGYSVNTLMRLLVGEDRQDGDRHLVLVAPDGWSVATGWGGVSARRQEIALRPDAENTSLLFGKVAFQRAEDGIEVAQFGASADRTGRVWELAHAMRAGYVATTGIAAPAVEHLYITEPGLGGTHTDGAISMGHPGVDAEGRLDAGTANFIAHEQFHAWLPGAVAAGEPGLEWFFEGFTDYFSLWHLASAGWITPQQFVDQLRLFDLLARESPAFGKVAFADRAVQWRAPDAERVAYQGGALFAFHLDATVRRAGTPGLPQLLRDLVHDHDSRYTLEALENWCDDHGAGDLWTQAAVAPDLPDLIRELVRLGCVETKEGTSRIVKVPPGALDGFLRFQAK